ncbi:MAG: hypothetical protein MK212_09050 [Saprospiraceae bacterium]|nr:hypothetical protein [Saprospiraceae bacterium]
MKIVYYLSLFFLLASTYACGDKINTAPRIQFTKNPINDLLADLREPNQKFTVDAAQNHLLKGKQGTLVSIPQSAFVDKDNKVITGNIEIELSEATDINDFAINGLQTVSPEGVLESGGMIYIDAKQNGNPIHLGAGKAISVEVPTKNKQADMELFSADMSKDEIIWFKVGKLRNDHLIQVPLELLEFDEIGMDSDFLHAAVGPSFLEDLEKASLTNSYIMTREFKERLNFIWTGGGYWGCTHTRKDISDMHPIYFDVNIFISIYCDPKYKNLGEADKAMLAYMEKEKKNMVDDRYGECVYMWREMFRGYRAYTAQNLGKPLEVEGINFDEEQTVESLESKGFDKQKVDQILSYYKMRQEVIKNLKQQIEDKATAERVFAYGAKLVSLGWVNCDRFMNDESAQECNLKAKINYSTTLETIRVSLMIPSRNISLYSLENKNNLHSFTNSSKTYSKLPVGEKAFIVAIAIHEGQSLLGIQEIEIPKEGIIDVSLEEVDKATLKAKLVGLNL